MLLYFAENVDLLGRYPADEFERTIRYELPLFVTKNPALRQFLDRLIHQVEEWLATCEIKKLGSSNMIKFLKGFLLFFS